MEDLGEFDAPPSRLGQVGGEGAALVGGQASEALRRTQRLGCAGARVGEMLQRDERPHRASANQKVGSPEDPRGFGP